MTSVFIVLYFMTVVFHLSSCRTDPISTPPQCDPNTIDEAPYQLQKVCAALSTMYRLSNAMETFLEESSPTQLQYFRSGSNDRFGSNERFDNSVKRQDLDHVFLRFGRRRR